MAVTDPDAIDRFDTIYGTNLQKISVYPVGDTQRNSGTTYNVTYVATTGTIGRATGDFTGDTGPITAGDVVCLMNGPNAGHYYAGPTAVATLAIEVAEIDTGTGGAAATSLTVEQKSFAPNADITGDTITVTGHGYVTGDPIVFMVESGGATAMTLPALGSTHWAIRVDANDIQLASSYANAIAGTQETIVDNSTTHTTGTFARMILVAGFTNGANAAESILGNATSGDGLGDVETGITIQALYSNGKDEWRTDSLITDLTPNYNDDLIRHEFPYEAITSEQFEVGGGSSHLDWTWFNIYSRKKVRTGGWADRDNASVTQTEYTGIVTLGSLDADTQVYYQQASTINPKVDFTFLGPVDEPIEVFNENVPASSFAVTAGPPGTLTRSDGGSWVTDGYVVGHQLTIRNAEVPGNDGDHTITAVAAGIDTAITVSSTLDATGSPDTTMIIGLNQKAYLKLFARKKGRTYAGSEISDIGVTTIQTIVNRFPLAHAVDTAITFTDANILGVNPFRFAADPDGTSAQLVTATDGVTVSLLDFTPTASPTFLTADVTVGDVLRVVSGGTAKVGYYEITAVTETTVTISSYETVSGNDFTFGTAWNTFEGSLTYDVYTSKIAATKSTEDATDRTTAGAGNGIINVAPATQPAGSLGSIVDTTAADFVSLGVAAGDLVYLTGSTAGVTQGIFKVVDTAYDANAAAPTTDTLFVNTVDRAWPGSLDAAATYQVFQPGMYLQFKQDLTETHVSTATVNEDIVFAAAGKTITLGTVFTWDASVAAGTMIDVSGTDSNDGRYTVLTRDSSAVVTLISTDVLVNETNTNAPVATVLVQEGFKRTIGSGIFAYRWAVTGNGGDLSQVFQFIQRELRSSADIDWAGGTSTGNITDLLMSFASPTGTGLDLFIDNLNTSDINNATFNDHSAAARKFPFTSSGNLVFNSNLVADANAKYWLYFTNDDTGDNLARDYGTKDAILVKDASTVPVDITGNVNGTGNHTGVAGTVAGGSISIPFTYDFDGNTQRGAASVSTVGPVTLVAIGLSSAQFVVVTGSITQSTTIVVSAVAAIERNYLTGTV